MEEQEVIQVHNLLIEPNMCPLSAPLALTMEYTLLFPVQAASWELTYEADYTNKRKCVTLFASEPQDMVPGRFTFSHALQQVNTEGIKEKYLLQVGVLKLALRSQVAGNVSTVNMVAQVSKDASGQLIRNIISPLEE